MTERFDDVDKLREYYSEKAREFDADNVSGLFVIDGATISLGFVKHPDKTNLQSVNEVFGKLDGLGFRTEQKSELNLCEAFLWLDKRGYKADVRPLFTWGKFKIDGLITSFINWFALKSVMRNLRNLEKYEEAENG